jgi:CheY-like chemotaxis protein
VPKLVGVGRHNLAAAGRYPPWHTGSISAHNSAHGTHLLHLFQKHSPPRLLAVTLTRSPSPRLAVSSLICPPPPTLSSRPVDALTPSLDGVSKDERLKLSLGQVGLPAITKHPFEETTVRPNLALTARGIKDGLATKQTVIMVFLALSTKAEHLLSLIRILMADDFEGWRHQVRLLLQVRTDLQVICEASDGAEAVQKADDLKPDLIVLDIGLPRLNGIDDARRIRQLSPASKILFLSQNNDPDVVQAALGAGALGCAHKTNAREELLPAIDAVLRGNQFVGSALKGKN